MEEADAKLWSWVKANFGNGWAPMNLLISNPIPRPIVIVTRAPLYDQPDQQLSRLCCARLPIGRCTLLMPRRTGAGSSRCTVYVGYHEKLLNVTLSDNHCTTLWNILNEEGDDLKNDAKKETLYKRQCSVAGSNCTVSRAIPPQIKWEGGKERGRDSLSLSLSLSLSPWSSGKLFH